MNATALFLSLVILSSAWCGLMSPSIEYFSSIIVFFSSVICLVPLNMFSLLKPHLVYALFSSVVLVLNFLSSKSLISISLRSISEVLTCSFIWHIILSSSFSLTLCIDVCASAKTTAFPQVLCREWTYHSAWSELWVVSQTFMMLSKLFSVTRSSWRYVELLLHVGILLFTQCVAVTLLISGFLSEGVASCVSAGLVCPWEEVRSGAFYVPSCTGTLSRTCQCSSYMKTFSEPSSPKQQSLGASYSFSLISCSEHTAFRMR